jgi:histidinol-phosphate aminotransferase
MNPYLRKNVQAIMPYKTDTSEYEVMLHANENPFNPFRDLKHEIMNALFECNGNRYPSIDAAPLRAALAKDMGFSQNQILCGNGSDEILQMIVQAFIDPDDTIISLAPTFSMYQFFAEVQGANFINVSADPATLQGSLEELANQANASKAKLIILCNPNNPTGQGFSKEEIMTLINSTKSLVLVDEAYIEFYGESMIDQINTCQRLIVTRTFSKAYGLAGIRVGYAVADASLIASLDLVRAPYNLNAASQAIAMVALKNKQLFKKQISLLLQERDRMERTLVEYPGLSLFPTKANFILIRSEEAENIEKACLESSIQIRGYQSVGLLKNCLRISIGKPEENDRLLAIFKEVHA